MIEIRNASKRINTRQVVNDLSLTVKKGGIFGFLGPNGAGKTTTMKMLVGLNEPTSGEILIDGASPSEGAARETIGFMPEAPYFYDQLTGLEFMQFCADLFRSRSRTRAECLELLSLVDLFDAAHRPISQYSKGMKQRLGFAQALINDPEYLFLDEPLDGLDPIGRRAMKRIMRDLKEKGKTIFFNSHILFDTEELCDEIGVLHHGSLLYTGPVRDFARGIPLEEAFVAAIESAESTVAL